MGADACSRRTSVVAYIGVKQQVDKHDRGNLRINVGDVSEIQT
jgi:hypothetical protein